MVIVLSLLLCAALSALFVTVFRTRRVVRELKDAVHLNRCLLVNEPSSTLKRLGFDGLIGETNGLIDRYRKFTDVESGHMNQLDAMLGSIQEAVIIFNDEHVIEFVNDSAQLLFQRGRMLKGVRLEVALRSPSLLDFLNTYRADRNLKMEQVSVEREGGELWFEASCAEVRGVASENAESTLLVLHDITRLKRLEVVRRDFVANVSHELRTPLTIIKGFAETLVEDNATLPVETRARFLDKIVNNAQRLHVLVEDLLVLSRLESKPEPVERCVQSLQSLMEEISDNYRSRLKVDEQMMELDFDDRVGEFAFERFRIQQVFDNLIENAFRYAPQFTRLVLRARYDEAENMVLCSVEDDGPGIPEKDAPHIFERFYRVDKGRSRVSGGTGLGLSIMKHIVHQHGGRVSVVSAVGQGTSIQFSLPYVQTLS
ncbi:MULTISPECIES: cell wall metabolism sensor histidine kinase WalK [unclassified Lentimonas]|uniref:sensor histidine kinase n=1 Tax=unclassified Lentimonas TaxID=2630993 RepID=UPI00132140B1|nr:MULTISPECIES: ATP-binding protein [unclassified Lentimonas]CAA6676408.1 Phosphate regulon sensor protein PhoR (SphS) (EC [Lentimonas sp. CC4]CAA6685247.1 Phosphate regulon sensor protein PhoR (SphS) (EC [Lentimonas sp. CC6]CAA7075028.1 Phosphate regulon sensor protein PhoR (SphS) (EC [Lentimonas sp. CC4]CAA7169668.1 Phosphate regulon sensor protein PhoR (SphS) (EC [Lentimonas sp. CC21]CAA7182052.1 Phosphate regulon sensor protein PhoR (SphS) (EC [Lentimonas sp. CC8]